MVTYCLAELLGGSIVDGAADLVPANICIYEIALVYWCSGSQREHNGPKRTQLVIHFPAFLDILSLESDLQTAAAHSKGHCIHVYMILLGSSAPHVVVFRPLVKVIIHGGIIKRPRRLLISEDGDIDLYFAAATGSDVRRKGWKAYVRVGDFVRDEV